VGSGAKTARSGDDDRMQGFARVEALFKGRHFDGQIIILCVSWYTSFKLSLRDLVIMMADRGITLTHTRFCAGSSVICSRSAGAAMLVRLADPGEWTRWSRGVTRWFRWGLSVSGPFVCRCLTSPSCSVFTPRSSNRTGAFNASGSRRKAHDFAHGRLWVRVVRRTSPSTACKSASGYCLVAGLSSLCLAHSH